MHSQLATYLQSSFLINSSPKDTAAKSILTTSSDEELQAFYSNTYESVDVADFLQTQRRERFMGLLNLVHETEFYLDVGCANGAHMDQLHNRGIYGVGLDVSVPNVLRGLEQRPHLKFIHGFAENIPFGDAYFDIAILGDVLEHFRDPIYALAEVLRISKTGFVTCFPNSPEKTAEHINPVTVHSFLELCDRFALDIYFYDKNGTALKNADESFFWCFARAEKTGKTDPIVQTILCKYKKHSEDRNRVLEIDQWKWGEVHQRQPEEIDRFSATSLAVIGKNILEVACGNGDLSIFLAQKGFTVTGIDISRTGIEQAVHYAAQERVTDLASFLVMDGTHLDFPDNTFDSVIFPEVFEHVTSSRLYIREAIRVLKPGGRIVISVPDTLEIPWPGHIRLFTKDSLAAEMEQYSKNIIWYEMNFKKWLLCAFTPDEKQGTDVPVAEPLVNILMATYNRHDLIKRAIHAIVCQTYANWKLLVLNDGGEDVRSIIDSFADNRILYYHFEHSGKAAALNRGLALIDAEYIAYMDDDDVIFPNHLEVLVRAALLNKKNFTYSDTYLTSVDENTGIVLDQTIENTADVDSTSLKFFNQINHKQILHTKRLADAAGLYDESLDVLIDYDYIKRLALAEQPYHVKLITGNHFLYHRDRQIATITGLWHRNPQACGASLVSIFKKHPQDMCDLYLGFRHYQSNTPKLEAQIAMLSQALSECEGPITCFNQALSEREKQIACLNQGLAERDVQLAAITGSRGWRLLTYLWRLRLIVVPRGSLRERCLRKGRQILRTFRQKSLGKLLHQTNLKTESCASPAQNTSNIGVDAGRTASGDQPGKHPFRLSDAAGIIRKFMMPLKIKTMLLAKKVLPFTWQDFLRKLLYYARNKRQRRLIKQTKAIFAIPGSDSFGTPESYDVICFPIIEWDHRFQRPQQLMNQFAQDGHRVFYLALTFHDRSAVVEWRKVAERIFNLCLPGPPDLDRFHKSITPAVADQCFKALDQFCAENRITNAICMVQLPFWTPLALRFREKFGWKIVFDCMDEHQGLTMLNPLMRHDESLLARKADLVMVSARKLWEKHAKQASRCMMLTNAVDFHHFNSCKTEGQILEDVSRPIIGYYGAIMEWFDAEMLITAAKSRPDWTFVLIGNVNTSSVDPLRGFTNVLFLGEQPYAKLPEYLHQFDICLIPFKPTPIIECTNPVKFYEYLSAGKPVVASPMPELLPYQELFYAARNGKELVEQVQRALLENNTALINRRINWARQETWHARYGILSDALKDIHQLVSIVIVSYQNLDKLRLCLESIFKKTHYPRYEIVVVDNGSSPDVIDYLQFMAGEHSHLHIILNGENLGFAKANNIGLKKISDDSRYIILLNNDTVVTYGWMVGLIRWLKDEDVGLVGPVTCPEGAANEAAVATDYENPTGLDEFAHRYTTKHRGRAFDIPMLAMYCLAMRRDIYQEIGPLDEQFGVGMFEDDDYSLRVRIKGYRVICAEDVFVHHFGRSSFSKINSREYQKLFDRNRSIFETKWKIKWQVHSTR